ncbi:MAG: DEAD/DEAH box helicase [Planctomycetota bacterium]|jgi:ATP-dependent RNA helicase DeaD
MNSFAGLSLHPATLDALVRMDITTPTPIQAAALEPLLHGRDVIGQARTGSGKTLAFGIPLIERVAPRRRAVQALVLTPTRELAVQVGGVLEALTVKRGIDIALLFGGRAAGPQRNALQRGAQVVVGTPGRVLDFLRQGVLRMDALKVLVLDEADEMLDRGFAPDVTRILAAAPRERQTALFSATVPAWVRRTSQRFLRDPLHASVDPRPEDSAPVPHVAFDVPAGEKMRALCDLLDQRGEGGSILVFGRTKHGVRKLARQLTQAGYAVAALQGNLSQPQRDRVMHRFRSGQVKILVATNVAARGIDIDDISHVINYELPETGALLTHRVGRTGRMGRDGQAITLLSPSDSLKWPDIEKGVGRRIARAPWLGAQAALEATPESVIATVPQRPMARPRVVFSGHRRRR